MCFKKKISYDLVIFGAKGDLARRKLIPSLYQLEISQNLNKNTRIIGVGRAEWNKKYYRKIVKISIKNFYHTKIKKKIWKIFKSRLYFLNIDVNNISDFSKLQKILFIKKKIIIHYFAIPQNTFGAICKGLGKYYLNSFKDRVILEKPIGNSLKTSKKINNTVGKYFHEKQIFRIDHYLGKETVLNLIALKFYNSLFFTNWNKTTVDHVQITVAEEVGIEGRWGYFDKIGQTRDMVQNHLLQILSIVAMSIPKNLKVKNIRKEKLKILKSLRKINSKNIHSSTIRGQYTSGFLNNIKIPGYIEEIGAVKKSNTETFVAIKVNIDTVEWAGVPFYLRTGKRLPTKYSEIVIYFKSKKYIKFQKNIPLNKLIIRLQPNEGIDIFITNKIPGLDSNYKLKEIKLNFDYKKSFKNIRLCDSYERLLLECSLGIQSLFVGRKEIEASWKWIDSILKSWKKNQSKLELYQAGTWGPESSNIILNKDNRNWHEIIF